MDDLGPPPVGIGTPQVESLTSVVRRLAAREVRTVSGLLAVYLRQASTIPSAPVVPKFIATSLTDSVNGASTLTEMLVHVLRDPCAADLRPSTLLDTRGHFTTFADFREYRQWCPLCLADACYDQQLWALRDVTVCVRHSVLLVDTPLCGHRHRPWDLRARPETCAWCPNPLTESAIVKAGLDALTTACAQIITTLQRGAAIRRSAIVAGVQALSSAGGLAAADLQRRTGLSRATVQGVVTGRSALSLSTLARLLCGTASPLSELLQHGDAELAAPRTSNPRPRARRDLAQLERALRREALLPPEKRRSLAAVASALRLGPHYPARYFPELVTPWNQLGRRRRGRPRSGHVLPAGPALSPTPSTSARKVMTAK